MYEETFRLSFQWYLLQCNIWYGTVGFYASLNT